MGLPLLSIFFSPFLALALSSEPIAKRKLVAVHPKAFKAGLCPGHPAQEIAPPGRFEQTPEDILQRGQRLLYAAQAAANVYSLPDLQTAKTTADMNTQMQAFAEHVPFNYSIYYVKSDVLSGLKFAIFQPEEASRPWILAIAGTQTALDWIADLDLGKKQLVHLDTLMSLFVSCQYLDNSNQPLASRPWIITGHSLGGGLAQALGYQIQKHRIERRLTPIQMQVITFNAFGAVKLVEKIEPFAPMIVPYLNAKNFFVDGDLISKVGTHIGPTLMIRPRSIQEIVRPWLKDIFHRHSMNTVKNFGGDIDQIISGFDYAVEQDPGCLYDFTALGSLGHFLPDAIYESVITRQRRLTKLKAMVDDLKVQPSSELLEAYIKDLILQEYFRTEKESDRRLPLGYREELKILLKRLNS